LPVIPLQSVDLFLAEYLCGWRILLIVVAIGFVVPSFANLSTCSFAIIPTWLGIQVIVVEICSFVIVAG
jgi:hypothetical protein